MIILTTDANSCNVANDFSTNMNYDQREKLSKLVTVDLFLRIN